MRIFPPPVEVADDEGFNTEKDIFGRADFGKSLAALVSNVEDPLVLLLDSPWGSGKTTFVRMWAGELRKVGHPVVYFDAFANDHHEDAFLALAGEVVAASTRAKAAKTPAHKKFMNRAVKAGKTLLRTGTKIAIKAATLNAVDAADVEAIKSVGTDLADATSGKVDDYVSALLKEQTKAAETMDSFRQALSEMASFLSIQSQPESHRPLIFIIDELDRCRPPFALDILESVKHLFSVSNVHFVIVAHLRQLVSSVRFTYGGDIDGGLYLQKFYNLVTHLPDAGEHPSERSTQKYISYLNKVLFKNQNNDDRAEMLRQLGAIAEANGYSLRSIERIATLINLSLAVTPKNWLRLGSLIPGLAAMKIMAPDLFRAAKDGTLLLDQAEQFLGFPRWPERGSVNREWVQQWWIYCLALELPQTNGVDWKRFGEDLSFRYNMDDRRRTVPWMATAIVDRLRSPD